MNSTFEELKNQALRLDKKEQALLAEELLSSLDSVTEDKNYEEDWLKEANSRYTAYKEGKIEAISSDEVHKEIMAGRKQI